MAAPGTELSFLKISGWSVLDREAGIRCGGASIIGLVALSDLAGCLLKGGTRPGAVLTLPQS